MDTLKSIVDSFNKLDKVIKFILLIVPFVGWIIELIIRWTEFLKDTSNVLNLVIAIIYTLCGWAWVLQLIDAIFVLLDKEMLFLK